jgi:glycosyltransferase involved in cell wall biosynthesis
MRPTISANLIVLNEAANLAACLESLRWVDEIVVVDGGSGDATVAVAREMATRVIEHPFDDFAAQRNRVLDSSAGDWVLSLDADERVPPALRDEVRHAIELAAADVSGYWVPIASHLFGRRFRWTGTEAERKMRLFRRTKGRWRGCVHETVQLTGRCGVLRHAIEHHSTPDFAAYRRKLRRYVPLEVARRRATGASPRRGGELLAPLWTFGRLYVAHLGVLDGVAGLQFAALSAWEQWLVQREFGRMGNGETRTRMGHPESAIRENAE